jgi:DNA-binding MarR family transcriptional regulator
MTKRRSAVQAELQQRLPFPSTRQEAFLGVLRTGAVMRRPVARVIEAQQLSMAQYNVLRILRGAGDSGLPTLGIRERMIEEAAGITRLIDKLERASLVRRSRHGAADRRQVYCCITTEGLALLRQLDPMVDLAIEAALAMLSEPELETLIGLLDRIRAEAPRGLGGRTGADLRVERKS